jgi:hypothetical protein
MATSVPVPVAMLTSAPRLRVAPNRHLFVPQEIGFADYHSATRDIADNTTCRDRTKIFHGFEGESLLLSAFHNRGGERMFAVLLQRGGKTQEFLRVEAAGAPSLHPPSCRR